jgi:release factor glutamine methyltransferase
MPAPVPPAPHDIADLVSVLRAAGCVFAEDEAQLLLSEAPSTAELAVWVERRVSGEPLECIIGWAEFCGLHIAVDPGVFVPRRRTELLVSEAAALLRDRSLLPASASSSAVVDLCCGSGAVGVALAARASLGELHLADIDPLAVQCARRNVAAVGGQVHQGDLYAALPARLRRQVQLIVVNAPYVPTGALPTMPPEARVHEPSRSLDGGVDGLDLHRRIIREAPEWLDPNGHLVIESSEPQAAGTAAVMAVAGFAARTVHSEELDGTIVVGTPRWR